MRFAIILTLAAGIAVGCASHNKQATDKDMKAEAKGMAKDAKAAAKDAKKAVKDAKTAATETMNSSKVECKLQKEVRLLEVRGKDKGCEVAYTKAAQENVVGSSMNGTAHCEGIVNRIKDKLVAAGYTCN